MNTFSTAVSHNGPSGISPVTGGGGGSAGTGAGAV